MKTHSSHIRNQKRGERGRYINVLSTFALHALTQGLNLRTLDYTDLDGLMWRAGFDLFF